MQNIVPMTRPSLELRASQHLAMTPSLQQSIKLLQLSALDLETEIAKALEDNPLLENLSAEASMTQQTTEPTTDASDQERETEDSGLMSEAVGIPQEQKSLFLRDSLQEWNLVEMIDETALEMHPMIQKIVTKFKVDDDLQRYVQDVKETIKILLQV